MKLSIQEFGKHLLTSGDLDPIYIALNKCDFPHDVRNRWLTAYCAFYSAGFACYASESEHEDFWDILEIAAKNTIAAPHGGRWERGKERRHFRGKQGIAAIEDWKFRSESPEYMMDYISAGAPSFQNTLGMAKDWRSVGNWMGFKLVDLVDACMGKEIDQSDVMLFMYETPRESLLRLWREKYGYAQNTKPKDEELVIRGMIEYYKEVFKAYECPHKPGKPIDMFCLETIFCKHQSHLNGHYPPYNDIDEIAHGLEKWMPYSEKAKLFYEKMPKRAA